MLEFMLMLAAAALVFAFFLLMYFLKEKSKEGPGRVHTCGQCNCDRKDDPRKSGITGCADRHLDDVSGNR